MSRGAWELFREAWRRSRVFTCKALAAAVVLVGCVLVALSVFIAPTACLSLASPASALPWAAAGLASLLVGLKLIATGLKMLDLIEGRER